MERALAAYGFLPFLSLSEPPCHVRIVAKILSRMLPWHAIASIESSAVLFAQKINTKNSLKPIASKARLCYTNQALREKPKADVGH